MSAFLRKYLSEINMAARRRHKKMINHYRNQRAQILISTTSQQLTEL
jgi:hypothetical protein